MEMVLVHDSFELAVFEKCNRDDRRQRELGVKHASKAIDAEDRAVPMWIKRHDLVERSHGESQRKNNHESGRKRTIARGLRKSFGLILFQRIANHDFGKKHPQ